MRSSTAVSIAATLLSALLVRAVPRPTGPAQTGVISLSYTNGTDIGYISNYGYYGIYGIPASDPANALRVTVYPDTPSDVIQYVYVSSPTFDGENSLGFTLLGGYPNPMPDYIGPDSSNTLALSLCSRTGPYSRPYYGGNNSLSTVQSQPQGTLPSESYIWTIDESVLTPHWINPDGLQANGTVVFSKGGATPGTVRVVGGVVGSGDEAAILTFVQQA